MNRLKELRKEKKLSQKQIAMDLDTPLRTYQRWENGESQIKSDKAQQLAEYFGVNTGYLLGYSDKEYRNALAHGVHQIPENKHASITQEEATLLASYRLLSLENQKQLKDIADNFIKYQIYTNPKNMLTILERYKLQYGWNIGIEELFKQVQLLQKVTDNESNQDKT